jgi:uncharacterized protein (DUF2141 family)
MKTWSKRAAGILAALAITVAAAGQTTGRITGRVSDGDGGYLAGAAVEVESPQSGVHSTKTDDDGRYLVPNLPAGRYTVRFRMDGYAPVDKRVQVPLDGRGIVDAKLFKVTG